MKIVLLPGLDGTGLLFRPLLDALPEHLDVLIISYPNEKLSYSALVTYVLERLPTEDYVLVGESFAGNIVYQIAKTKPVHLKSIIFVATFLTSPRPVLLKLFNVLPSYLLSIKPAKIIVKLFMLGFSIDDKTIHLFLESLKKVPADVLSFRLREIEKLNLAKLSHDIDNIENCEIRTTYIQATNDYLVPVRNSEYFKRVCSNLTIIPVLGPHFVLQAKPNECAEIIKNQL